GDRVGERVPLCPDRCRVRQGAGVDKNPPLTRQGGDVIKPFGDRLSGGAGGRDQGQAKGREHSRWAAETIGHRRLLAAAAPILNVQLKKTGRPRPTNTPPSVVARRPV